jgi:hypothetical protein
MVGYPGVAILDVHGHVVQHPAIRKPGPGTSGPVPVRLITLRPSQGATFLLTSVNNVPNPDCPTAYTGTQLQVYPPSQTSAIVQPYRSVFCDLEVGPVQMRS